MTAAESPDLKPKTPTHCISYLISTMNQQPLLKPCSCQNLDRSTRRREFEILTHLTCEAGLTKCVDEVE